MKLTLFRKIPETKKKRRYLIGLNTYGDLKLNGDYDSLKLKLVDTRVRKNHKVAFLIFEEIKKILIKYDYEPTNMHHYNRSHHHKKSYLKIP